MTTSADDVLALAARCRVLLGPPQGWTAPPGYPDSLALCVIDSIWSIGIRYSSVERVVGRYRTRRAALSGDADFDGAGDLLRDFDAAGGTEPWRKAVGTRHLTSTRGGIPKAEAVRRAAEALTTSGIDSAGKLRAADDDLLCRAEAAWVAVRGQRSGISWRYLLLLSGVQQVKPDRMICRFAERAVGRRPTPAYAANLVTAAAAELGVDVRTLDHRIWRHESGRG